MSEEYTIEYAREMYQQWLAAEVKVSTGQSYEIGARKLTRVDLPGIKERQAYWLNEITRLAAGRRRGARILRGVPRDL